MLRTAVNVPAGAERLGPGGSMMWVVHSLHLFHLMSKTHIWPGLALVLPPLDQTRPTALSR